MRYPVHPTHLHRPLEAALRVRIDWDLCAGAGLCAAVAPRVFAVVEAAPGRRRAVLVAPADHGTLTAAAFACPTLAIRIDGDDGRPIYPTPAAAGGA